MNRFYCTVCKKVKRVRKYPTSVFNPIAPLPEDRIGQCNWHVVGRIKPIRRVSVRVRPNEVKVSVPKRKR